MFFSGFQIVFEKMAAICSDFKWLGFHISDSIKKPGHLQTNLFLTIPNPDQSGFQIPTVTEFFGFYLQNIPGSDVVFQDFDFFVSLFLDLGTELLERLELKIQNKVKKWQDSRNPKIWNIKNRNFLQPIFEWQEYSKSKSFGSQAVLGY